MNIIYGPPNAAKAAVLRDRLQRDPNLALVCGTAQSAEALRAEIRKQLAESPDYAASVTDRVVTLNEYDRGDLRHLPIRTLDVDDIESLLKTVLRADVDHVGASSVIQPTRSAVYGADRVHSL